MPIEPSVARAMETSRAVLVAGIGAVIAAGAYVVAVGVLALRRKLRKQAAPLDVAVPALFAS